MPANQGKPTITSDGTHVYRQKTIKVVCTEQDALELVSPVSNLVAYTYGITHTGEMPSLKTFENTLLKTRTRLATLMANTLGRVINPNHLRLLIVETIVSGGYFRVFLTERIPADDQNPAKLYRWAVKLVPENSTPLIVKIAKVIRQRQPMLSENQALDLAIRWLH